jgi:tripartite ATP-independent transporter DctM subunit
MLPVSITVLLLILASSVPVAAGLILLGLTLDHLYSFLPLRLAMGEISWSVSTNFILFAIPLFILLGEVLLRSGIAERMYAAMRHWLSWLPGGLMHSNIGASTLFAAISGSSVATAATIGTVAASQVETYGYNERLYFGTIAAGGTLGILIPPSIPMIVYGALTDTSIPKLYLAGFLPGFLLAGLFMVTIVVACVARPAWGGRKVEASWEARLGSLPDLLPPLAIFLVVIGSIYAGIATPTESAALGVAAAFILAGWRRRLSLRVLADIFEGTMRTNAMIMAILIAAYFVNFIITSIGLSGQVTKFVTGLALSPTGTIVAIVIFYVILGMFMESLSMLVATVPLVTPVVLALGFDGVWFGILMMLLIETALITPPVGFNLFVVQGVRGRGQMYEVALGSAPFVVTLMIMIALLIAFPEIALWIPRHVPS